MALSSREVLLVLRARDEATRVMGRVSSAMSKMDRNAMIASQRAVRQNQASMVAAQGALREQDRALIQLRRNAQEVEYAYRNQTVAAREQWMQGKISARQYREAMLAAQKMRVEQVEQIRVAKNAQEDQIRNQRRVIAGIRDEQNAIHDRIRAVHDEREALRDRGRMMQANGVATASMGAALTYFSAIGLQAYASNIQSAMDYQTAMTGVKTQIDDASISVNDLKKLGKEVGREVPVAFEEIPPALWAIFSSVEVGLGGARKLIKRFSKDAVAGQTDLATATKTNLAIMNAYNLKTKDMTEVSDTMFRLVQKGIGSYEEFGNVIGRAIPSAVRAGQSYKTVAAMLAFMTKNGMSAAMSATSAARALDAISKSKVADRLKKMGINVKDASGEFRPLVKILGDMNDKFKDLTGPERADALEELFKGAGGTIQARRFFDSYFKDAKTFNKLTETMENSAGTAQKKFEEMAESPQAKLQQLKNNWQILRIELGENLLPIAMKIVDTVNGWIDAFNRLDPKTKKIIAWAGAAVLVLGTLLGVLTIIVGVVGIFAGTAAALGIGLGTLAAIVGGIVLAIVALGAALGISVKNWDDVKEAAGRVKDKFEDFKGWVQDNFGQAISDALDGVKKAFERFTSDVEEAWNNFKENVDWEDLKKDFEDVKTTIEEHKNEIKAAITAIGIVIGFMVFQVGMNLRMLGAFFGPVFEGIIGVVTSTIKGIIKIFTGFVGMWMGIFNFWKSLFTGDWKGAWKAVQDIVSGALDIINGLWNVSGGALLQIIGGIIQGIINLFKELYDILVGHSIVPDLIDRIIDLFTGLPGKIMGALGDLVSKVAGRFQEMANGAKKKVENLVTDAVSKVKRIPGKLWDALSEAPTKLKERGKQFVQGLIDGLDAMKDPLVTMANTLANAVEGALGKLKGLLGGLKDTAASAAGSVWGAVTAPFSGRVAGKAKSGPKISKKYQKLINMVQTNIVGDIADTMPQIGDVAAIAADFIDAKFDKKAKKLKGKALKKFNKTRGKKAKGLLADVVAATAADVAKLQQVTTAYQAKLDEIEKATNALENLMQEKASFIDSVNNDLMSFGGFSGLQKPADVFGNEEDWTASNISSQLQSRLTDIKTFGSNLQKLLDMGFGEQVYRQVIEMGIIDGAAFAAALIQATPDEVNNIKGLVSQITESSNGIANAAGNQLYNAGIAAAQGFVQGLQSEADALYATATALGNSIAAAVKNALGIASPSKVANDIAANFGGTLARGLLNQTDQVSRASDVLAKAMMIDPSATFAATPYSPVVGQYASSALGQNQGTTINQEINITTNEIDPRRNAAELGWELAARFGG